MAKWAARQPEAITGDPLWRLQCYREALFVVELVADDVKALGNGPSRAEAAAQLLTAVGSVAANIAEGYGRPTNADRVRFLSYALGSAREAIAWYQTVRPWREDDAIDDRLARLARVRRMLLGLLTQLRTKTGRPFDRW